MVASKEQEGKALEQIKKIVDSLGPDSYIGTAFKGCFDVAHNNIVSDFADSLYDRLQRANATITKLEKNYNAAHEEHNQLQKAHGEACEAITERDKRLGTMETKSRNLQTALDASNLELWKLKASLYDKITASQKAEKHTKKGSSGSNMSQSDYENLEKSAESLIGHCDKNTVLTDDEAKKLVGEEFGFEISKIEILHEAEIDISEADSPFLKIKKVPRKPVYDASDWNYIRFNIHGCAGEWYYEMINGDIQPVIL